MTKYNLTGSLETSFTFSIGEYEFNFRKPTVREMREIGKVFAEVEKEQDAVKSVDLGDKAMDTVYSLATPVNHDRALRELLDDQPVGVQTAFNEMLKKEIGTGK